MHTTAWPIINGEKSLVLPCIKLIMVLIQEKLFTKSFKILLNDNAETIFLKYIQYGILLFKENIDKLLLNKYYLKNKILQIQLIIAKIKLNLKI